MENVLDKKYRDYQLMLSLIRHALRTLYIYAKNSFPGFQFNNLFAELQLFFIYTFSQLYPQPPVASMFLHTC